MLLFLRDADVVDEWLRAQQQATATNSQADIDLETCEKEIHDLEKRQGITSKNQYTKSNSDCIELIRLCSIEL